MKIRRNPVFSFPATPPSVNEDSKHSPGSNYFDTGSGFEVNRSVN